MSSPSQAPDLRLRFQELNTLSSQEAASLAAKGERTTLWRLLFTPLGIFLRSYLGQQQWRKGVAGIINAMFAAYAAFVRYAKLWEIHHTTDTIPPPQP